jgi:hypothetical protein
VAGTPEGAQEPYRCARFRNNARRGIEIVHGHAIAAHAEQEISSGINRYRAARVLE